MCRITCGGPVVTSQAWVKTRYQSLTYTKTTRARGDGNVPPCDQVKASNYEANRAILPGCFNASALVASAGFNMAASTSPTIPNPTTCSTISPSVKAAGNPYQFQCGTLTAMPALRPMTATNSARLKNDLTDPSVIWTSTAAMNELSTLVVSSITSWPPVIIGPGGG